MDEKLSQIIQRFQEVTQKECYLVKLTKGQPPIFDNKIGGQPYLPVGEEYPTDHNGNPLNLLLQVNLKDIDLPGYPKKGILEIFTDADVQDYAVKYFDACLAYQTNLPTVDTSHYIVDASYGIELTKTFAYMSINDYRFDKVMSGVVNEICGTAVQTFNDLNELFGEELFKKVEALSSSVPIAIGGYADFTQSDPRRELQENYDECLFKLDSYADMERIHLGDAGILFALISQQAIKECKFNQAIVGMDCG